MIFLAPSKLDEFKTPSEEVGSQVATMEKVEHPITAEGQTYLNSLDEQTKKVYEMAQKKLGSSYFVERTNGFRAWKAKQKATVTPVSQPPGVK